MATDTRITKYWREEFALIGVLLLFFSGIIIFAIGLPFDARLFPMVIGSTGIVLALIIAFQERQRYQTPAEPVVSARDPAANATWARFATALLAAPTFAVVFWLFGFFIASFAAMLLMPMLMGYADRKRMLLVGVATVAFLAVFFPYLAGVSLPHGVVGDWLIDTLRSN